MVLSFPFLFNKFHRITRDMLRFSLGGIFALTPWLLWHKYYLIGAVFVSILFCVRRVYMLLRKTLQNTECQKCDEFHQDKICSGFSFKAKQMREYEKTVVEWSLSRK
ncbi:hypothetical protein MNBD_UNCLBAC01-1773 [hydrothermal vent metagenome]|uniref:Uncharacterized protein n=1 Tax=hydrothermal vent metagenome TaxID=652676 RepID=A0A3B1CYX0_9ZZZZ